MFPMQQEPMQFNPLAMFGALANLPEPVQPRVLPPEFNKYILGAANQPDDKEKRDLKEILDRHFPRQEEWTPIEGKLNIIQHPNVPGWILKGIRRDFFGLVLAPDAHIYRVVRAEEYQQGINQHNLKHAFVLPKKYLYQHDSKWWVVAQKIDFVALTANDISAEQADGIIYLQFHNNLNDCSGGNLKKTAEGKIAIIDTEPLDRIQHRHLSSSFMSKLIGQDCPMMIQNLSKALLFKGFCTDNAPAIKAISRRIGIETVLFTLKKVAVLAVAFFTMAVASYTLPLVGIIAVAALCTLVATRAFAQMYIIKTVHTVAATPIGKQILELLGKAMGNNDPMALMAAAPNLMPQIMAGDATLANLYQKALSLVGTDLVDIIKGIRPMNNWFYAKKIAILSVSLAATAGGIYLGAPITLLAGLCTLVATRTIAQMVVMYKISPFIEIIQGFIPQANT